MARSLKPDGGDGRPGAMLPSVRGPALSSFVGRERELKEIEDLLRTARLVTLTGPGGSGKTRLVLAAAERLTTSDGRTVHVVELAALRDPALVPAAITTALGLRATAVETPLDLLARHLATGDVLLVLDNLEQLLPAATSIGELLARCPRLCVLTTSRVPLGLSAERRVEVQPLALPPQGASIEELEAAPAVALFLERARAVERSFALSPANAETVMAICRRLDGLPLALELAAARLRLLPPAALLARLEHGLAVLTGGPVDAEERHRTLRDTIAWSVGLLPAREAGLFARLGVFAGGFTFAAARDVAAPGILGDEDELWEALGVLVDHSLVRVAPDLESEPRFGMLETIHEYAAELLDEEGELRERHLRHYLALAEEAAAGLEGPGRRSRARRLDDEAENLRAALSHAEAHLRAADMLRLTAALGFYWREHGDLREGRDWLEHAIALAEPDPSSPLAQSLLGLSRIVMVLGDRRRGQVLADEAFEVACAIGDERDAGRALFYGAIGMVDEGAPRRCGRCAQAIARHGRAGATMRPWSATAC